MIQASRVFTSLLVLSMGTLGGLAAANEHAKHATNPTEMAADRFVQESALGGMAEVAAGNLAIERAQNPDVKEFGRRMVQDHSKANDELKQLAARKGWSVPTELDPKHKAMVDHFSALSGAEFDREYAKEMVKDHDHDVKVFEAYARKGDDPDLKSWATQTLPTLREHQQMAKANAGKVGVTVASSHTEGTTSAQKQK